VFQSARYAPRIDCADAPKAGPPPAPAIDPGPAIAITPATAPDCSFLSPFRATARWDAGNPTLAHVEVWVGMPGGKRTLWAGGAERSESSTGQWATPGMTFTLIDPATQQTLARTEIARIACPAH